MGKITEVIEFSTAFQVDPMQLEHFGVLDPCLNVDTPLFIDPMLLKDSIHPEMSDGAVRSYDHHFTRVIKLLAKSKAEMDVGWRSALRLLQFPEIKGTCLGYGSSSIAGSGAGAEITNEMIRTAREIIEIGVDDPDLFVAMSLFEAGIGPDRVSDMTTNVIMADLLTFNERILDDLSVQTEEFEIVVGSGARFATFLPVNPYSVDRTPVILVPTDVLRDLPIAQDWSEISEAADHNQRLRDQANDEIAQIWQRRTLEQKDKLKSWLMRDGDNFKTFIEIMQGASAQAYDLAGDRLGLFVWKRIASEIAPHLATGVPGPTEPTVEAVAKVVEEIITQFKFLIEKRRYSEELYHEGRPRPEKAAQRLFFAVAYAYCKANGIDLIPEAESGYGPVDFKMSVGFGGRVLVEIKLSRNPKVVDGYTKQLKTYEEAEETARGYYVVIDVGNMGEKDQRLIDAHNELAKQGRQSSEIVFIDGTRKASASKL
ncbi:MAG: hypothetical protein JJ855_19300 [Rhodospirillales bacterium]|nr:hypothetical protein [Rhodospirillales bacterium]